MSRRARCHHYLRLCRSLYVFAHFGDLPPKPFEFALNNTEWEIDDAVFIIFMSSIAMAFACGAAPVFVLRVDDDDGGVRQFLRLA